MKKGKRKKAKKQKKKDEIIPYGFQGIGIFEMRRVFKGKALLADDPGLGKTLQAILASLPFRRKRPILVVCPSGVKYQWQRMIKKIAKMDSWVLEGRRPPRRLPLEIPPFIIVNWEILQYWKKKIKQLNPSCILGDEIHYAKNRHAKRTKAFQVICRQKGVICIYGLSGTAFENYPAELWVILNILKPKIFPSFKQFGMRYCKPRYTHWGIQYDGATRKKELRMLLLKHCMVRRRFEEVVKELPPVTRSVVPMKIDIKAYKEAERNMTRWIMKTKPAKAFKAQRLSMMAKFNYLLQYTAELKIKEICKWIDNFLETTNEKLCIFGYHRAFLEALHDKYPNNSVLRYGGMTPKKRELVLDQFIRKPKKRIWFGSIPAAGTGMDGLQQVCRIMGIGELIHNPMKIFQVEQRINRLGQKHPVTINYFLAEGTVEQKLCTTIIRKMKNFGHIMDGRRGKMEFDVLKKIIKSII